MSIEISGIKKRFGTFQALKGIDLKAGRNEFLALLGPSGSGKTTLLRIIAGLEFPDEGVIRFEGVDVATRTARDRKVGFVFQHYALFRHMTVFENVAFGLRVKPRGSRPSEAEIRSRVMRLLALVQLDWLADRYPSQLSGGQRQRVALARALAIEPEVLLLDEPFGALDAKVRKELRRWLRTLHEEMGLTSIFVTHDQEEALELADRVVVMNLGAIEQVGTPQKIYEEPSSPYVFDFIGNTNRFECEVVDGHVRIDGWEAPVAEHEGVNSAPALAYVRPHDLFLRRQGQGPGVAARVRHVFAAGPTLRIECEASGGRIIEADVPRHAWAALGLQPGDLVAMEPRSIKVFLNS
jgi:sulfate transport system ATP-binding protein